MKPSGRYALKLSRPLSGETHITNQPINGVYKYSYNLAILRFQSQQRQPDAMNSSAKAFTETRDITMDGHNAIQDELQHYLHAGQNAFVSKTFSSARNITVTANSLRERSKTSREDVDVIMEPQESSRSSTKDLLQRSNRCEQINVKGCTKEYNYFQDQDSVDPATTPIHDDFTREFHHFKEFHGTEEAAEAEHEYGRSGLNFKRDFYPPIETIRRAARVLGVCLPSKELYLSLNHREIPRNSVCEGEDSCLKHGTLLKILNKRF